MNSSVLEIVEFRTTGDAAAVHKAALEMEGWLQQQPGFRWRRLASLDDGAWLDCIEWADMASAEAAAAQIMTAEPAKAFGTVIDWPSVVMRHARVVVSC